MNEYNVDHICLLFLLREREGEGTPTRIVFWELCMGVMGKNTHFHERTFTRLVHPKKEKCDHMYICCVSMWIKTSIPINIIKIIVELQGVDYTKSFNYCKNHLKYFSSSWKLQKASAKVVRMHRGGFKYFRMRLSMMTKFIGKLQSIAFYW